MPARQKMKSHKIKTIYANNQINNVKMN